MRFTIFIATVFAMALFVGCSHVETPSADAAPVNSLCPIMGHEIAADGGSTTWNGQTVGFCCEGCLPKWIALSEEEKAAKISTANQPSHDHSEHKS